MTPSSRRGLLVRLSTFSSGTTDHLTTVVNVTVWLLFTTYRQCLYKLHYMVSRSVAVSKNIINVLQLFQREPAAVQAAGEGNHSVPSCPDSALQRGLLQTGRVENDRHRWPDWHSRPHPQKFPVCLVLSIYYLISNQYSEVAVYLLNILY